MALRQLLTDVAPGDVIVWRDHFRLGRDAIDSAVTVRELVRDRRARLFYYSSGQEVAFQSAIDAAMTFIQGVGARPVNFYQPIDEVNGALVDFLKASVLTEGVVAEVIASIKAQVEQELSEPSDTSGAEQDLAKLKAEQKRYAAMVAQAPDIPELLVEMRKRQTRIRELEAELAAAHRLPQLKRDLLGKVERAAQEKLAALREALGRRPGGHAPGLPGALPGRPALLARRIRRPEVLVDSRKRPARPFRSLTRVTPPGIEPGIAP